MNKKGFAPLIVIIIIALIVGAGTVGYQAIKTRNKAITSTTLNDGSTSTTVLSPTSISSSYPSQSDIKTPIVEHDITNQPAYLIDVYSKNEKDYIDVDYVEWLEGEAGLKAAIEDGKCPDPSHCPPYNLGYRRNQNPKIRTFEVSPSVSINVNGNIAYVINKIDQTNLGDPYGLNLPISFKKLKDAALLCPRLPADSLFKKPITFVTIDVENNIVTKIIEIYIP